MDKISHARRSFLIALAGFGALGENQAQLNNSQMKIIVPFPAGGTADALPRILAEELRADFTGGVIIENRSGAGGNIGAGVVYHAIPDGTVLMASPPGPIAINQSLYRKLDFDPNLWEPVTIMASVPNVIDVSPKVPMRSVQELVAYAKANPGKLSYASQGNGSTSHLTAELFMSLTGIEMLHIPYKGTAPALVDIMGGQVDVFFDNLASSLTYHNAKKLSILAVADDKRSFALPEIPTFKEAGVDGMEAITWFAIVAPPKTPKPIIENYHKLFLRALSNSSVIQRFREQGADPRGDTPGQTKEFIAKEVVKWGKIIRSAHVILQ
ncbi:MAG: tripartite tricarboxylate transporter substrate binding protein [Comamonadaceae bacterium]|nr:tripartite tricarboxylate transporter substrate binding protein [Comamonadaceae bacterium]